MIRARKRVHGVMSSIDNKNTSQKLVRAINLDGGALSKTLERLSAGVKTASNSNDSADVQLASKLNTDQRLYNQALSNVNDAITVTNVASQALSALSNILTQQSELAELAQSTTLSQAKRDLIQEESNRLTDNFNHIVETTKVDTVQLLDKPRTSVNVQAGTNGTSGQIGFELGLGSSITTGPVDYEYSDPFAEELINQQLADINGDGNLDVVGVAGQNAEVYLGDGGGGFTKLQSFSIETDYPGLIELADFNGDGNLDLLQVSRLNGTTSRPTDGADAAKVHFGNSNGTFGAAQTPDANFVASTAGDFNGDGRDDASGFVWLSSLNQWRETTIFGNADGTFTDPYAADSPFIAQATITAVTANLNGSGAEEVVRTYVDGGTSPYFFASYIGGLVEGVLEGLAIINNVNAGRESDPLVADFNNDGDLDVVLTYNSGLRLYYGNGDNTFQAGVYTALSNSPGDSEAGDLNNDGNIDIIRSNLTLFGNGNGTFSQSTHISGGSANFQLGDVNNDGALDIVSNVLRISHINTLNETRISYLNLTNASAATSAETFIDSVTSVIELESGKIAAAQSRLSQAAGFVEVMRENSAAASNKITQIDYAEETARLVSIQVRLNASMALLAQASKISLSVVDILK